MAEPEGRRCPRCETRKPAAEFYAGCAECKACKRNRSKANRATQARKLAAVDSIAVIERFIDVLMILADKAGQSPAAREETAA